MICSLYCLFIIDTNNNPPRQLTIQVSEDKNRDELKFLFGGKSKLSPLFLFLRNEMKVYFF